MTNFDPLSRVLQKHTFLSTNTSREKCQEYLPEILKTLKSSQKLQTHGYQGDIYTARMDGKKVLVKSATGWGVATWINQWLLRREYNTYRHLDGVSGVPRCYGFFLNRYLVLEYVDAQTMRDACIIDREAFLAEMWNIMREIHSRGVAHGDLKRKDNILITRDSKPYLIDFGVSAIRMRGFRPLNYFWYRFCYQHDLNAWLKHKYGRNRVNMSPADASLYKPLWGERISRVIKKLYNRLTGRKKQRSKCGKPVAEKV